MALTRVTCPECDATLKSPTGFDVGDVIKCPKCKSDFEVEEPEDEAAKKPAKAAAGKKPVKAASRDDDDEDDDDDRPRKKKKRRDDDEDAKSNVAFYIRLGVLLTIMIGLGIALLVLGKGGLAKMFE